MPSLWSPPNWPQRLAELQAPTGELKEAPLRRDVRSLGMLLGEVLREQAGAPVFEAVEDLRHTAIARREATATEPGAPEPALSLPKGLALLTGVPGDRSSSLGWLRSGRP